MTQENWTSRENTPQHVFNLRFVWDAIRKFRRYILGSILLATAIAFVLTMPSIHAPQFKSSTIIFPASADRFDGTRVFSRNEEFYLYGSSEDLERLSEMAKSEDVMMAVIDSLDLWSAYVIDRNSGSPRFYVMEEFKGNVNITKAEGNGLSIEAFDADPVRAAAIVNVMVAEVDKIITGLTLKNKLYIRHIYEKSERETSLRLSLLQDSVSLLRAKYNVLVRENQTEMLVEQILVAEGMYASEKAKLAEYAKRYPETDTVVINTRARMLGYQGKVNALVKNSSGSSINLEKFRQGMDLVGTMDERVGSLTKRQDDVRDRLVQLEAVNGGFSSIHVIAQAKPSDKKARPVRWVLLLASMLLSAFAATGVCVLIENIRQRNQHLSAA